MKNLLKITLTLLTAIVMSVGIFRPEILLGTPASRAVGNWYQQFMPNLNGRTILDITFLDSLTGYSLTSISSDTSYILKTTNGGDSWLINYRAPSFIFRRVQFLNNNTGYVAGQNLIKTTNAGLNWIPINNSLFIEDIHFIDDDSAWYADPNSFAGGVFFTSTGGASWVQQFSGGNQNPNKIFMYNRRIGFMSNNSGSPNIYRTTNSGVNWNLNVPGQYIRDVQFGDTLIGWYSYGNNVYKTTNGGNNWIIQVLPFGGIILNTGIDKFSVINSDTLWGVGGTVFYGAGQFRGMIYRTVDGGNNWLFQVPDTTIHIPQYKFIHFMNKRNGWAYSVGSNGIHTTNGGDTTFLLGLHLISNEVPKEFKLYQNYPNPFNPVTNIGFRISGSGLVTLKIFDITGREVITLINEELRTGEYKTDWHASGYSSGVYFYKLSVTTGKEVFTETKKMVLIK